MINTVLDLPPAMQIGGPDWKNGILAQYIYNESKRRLKGTYAPDFIKLIFDIKENDKEWKKQFNKLFAVAFLTEEESNEWIETKLNPLVKHTNWKFITPYNYTIWKYVAFKSYMFRDFKNHRDVWVPTIECTNGEETRIWATTAAFDMFESYDDLKFIENFSGIYENDKAISGEALYKEYKSSFNYKDNDYKVICHTYDGVEKLMIAKYDMRWAAKENSRRYEMIKTIPNSNTFIGGTLDVSLSNTIYATPTNKIYGYIKGSEFKVLFEKLGVDGKGHTIVPDESVFPKHLTVRENDYLGERDTLLSKETILKNIEDDTIYPIRLSGWHRYSIPFFPDGHNMKRWQCQFDFWEPDRSLSSLDWTVETEKDYTDLDEILYRIYRNDALLEYIPEASPADYWIKRLNEIDKVSYKRTWDISAEQWGTETLY